MERHRCKLCLRNFANGRALGGHMRSHMMNFYAGKTQEEEEEGQVPFDEKIDFYSSSEEEESGEVKGLFGYGLGENPKKKSKLLVDSEHSVAAASIVLQEGETSEAESSKGKNPICRRSKRARKSSSVFSYCNNKMLEKSKFGKEVLEDEPMSSISDTTTEEDVAYCLMMLSRDKWRKEEKQVEEEEEEEEEDYNYSQDSGTFGKVMKRNGKYRCETCSKLFRSYQALGGHRASHKKMKAAAAEMGRNGGGSKAAAAVEEKIHECPFCHRVFSSGQALGGHKRSHFIHAGGIGSFKPFPRIGENLEIDLNLPPPPTDDHDEISQVADSAVSDAEFYPHS